MNFLQLQKINIDESEAYAILANKSGSVLVYIINPEKKYIWMLSRILSFNKTEIASLTIGENLNMFISCSKNGNCMLYSLPRIKLYNSQRINPHGEKEKKGIFFPIIIVFHSPLPCFIFYIRNLNYLYVYSINGKHLKKYKVETKYIDYQLKDYLMIYNSNDRTIDIYRGIDFEFVTNDFVLVKGLDQALILVENNGKNDGSEKSDVKYKILVLKDKENDLK